VVELTGGYGVSAKGGDGDLILKKYFLKKTLLKHKNKTPRKLNQE
jgi:hypothetical protein